MADRENDFMAEAPTYNGGVGRIYESLKPGGTEMHWFWAMNAFGDDISNVGDLSGHARAAAARVEAAWFAAIKGSRHEQPNAAEPARPPVNRYAAAKGR